jgi:hypothetical protein
MADLVVSDLGTALKIVTLATMIKRAKLNRAERLLIGNHLRDLADELEHEQADSELLIRRQKQ